MCDFCNRERTTTLVELIDSNGDAEPWAVSICDECIADAKQNGYQVIEQKCD